MILNGLKSLGKLIVDAVSAVAGAVWAFFTNPIGTIVSAITWVVDFLGGLVKLIIDAFLDLFKFLFIPDDKYIDGNFKKLQTTLNSKVDVSAYKNVMDSMQNVSKVAPNVARSSFLGTSFNIDIISFINQHRDITDWIIRGVAFYSILQYHINNVYKLIRGGNLDDGGEG